MKGFFPSSPIKIISPKLSQCGKCGLYKKCISPKMEVTGEGERKILFVAEAPGEQEDRQGEQFIGDAGQLLRNVLYDIEVDLDECWKTNAVICRPPKNKIEPYMISCCRPNLLKTIKKLKPNVIIILGKSALDSIMFQEWKKPLGPLGKWIGWNIPSQSYNAWLCPTYHPSYILRMGEDQQLMKIFKDHLKNAFEYENREVRKYSLEELKNRIEIFTDPNQGRKRMIKLFRKGEGTLAFDYETNGLKPDKKGHKIISVSFCLNGDDTFATMLDQKGMDVLSAILLDRKFKKVASNLKFEERWTKAIFNHGVKRWVWDTMLAAHCLDNRPAISSIKFQAYIYLGVSDYDSGVSSYFKSKNSNGFNRIEEIDKKELLIYNGLDSLLEYKIMVEQRRIFNAQ